MKKIVAAMMMTSALMANESGIYVGVDVGSADNTDKMSVEGATSKNDNQYNEVKVKVGFEADEATKVQLTFSKIEYDEKVFPNSTGTTLYEGGIDLIKEFEVTSSLYPFIKIGIGYGKMDSKHAVMDNVKEISSNIGAGILYKLIGGVSAEVGCDYVYRRWDNVSDGSFTYEMRGSAIKPYVGLNYEF